MAALETPSTLDVQEISVGGDNESVGDAHQWAKVGLWNPDHSLSVPCLKCNDELNMQGDARTIIPNGFDTVVDGIQLDLMDDPTGSVAKIVCREISRDYQAQKLDLKPGDIVVDVGAHIGIVGIYLDKKYPGI